MEQIFYAIGIGIASLIVGFFLGRIIPKKSHRSNDGTILIEPSQDSPEKDTFRLIFGIELDDIKSKSEIIFNVEDHTKYS